ncbi:MAG: two-component system alkaline phosphatase synthesis response regulator PhoP [Sphingobacteriales bacterium]|jgi:two-component system alkaline phosphatase synthesis response regulator PhoP
MDKNNTKIAIIEDDENLRFLIKHRLEAEGYKIIETANGAEAEELIKKENPDVVLLDWMLPGKMGDEICQGLRDSGFNNIIIMTTAKGQDVDKINAYKFGVTDFMAKPFNIEVLSALIENKLSFSKMISENDEVMEFNGFKHQPSIHLLTKDGVRTELTILENRILFHFLKNPNNVISREDLIKTVWGYSSDVNTRTLDMHIVRLRKKIEQNPESPTQLETVRGVGYRFNVA